MAEEKEEGGESTSEKKAKKQLPIKLIAIVVGVLAVLGAAGFFLWPMLSHGKEKTEAKKEKPKEEEEEDKEAGKEIAFLTLPEILFNLKATKGKGSILKATFVLELRKVLDKEKVEHLKPLIIDQLQSYLRELEVTDIQGAAGLERIRQELLTRINISIAPIKIRQVLVKDFIIQ
jgi:flagellar FliL protein